MKLEKNTVTDIRFRNFVLLFDEFKDSIYKRDPTAPEKGMLKLFAEQVSMSDRYLSHIKCGRKPIGHAVARTLEVGGGKPSGWMDADHNSVAKTAEAVGAKSKAEREYVETAMEIWRISPSVAQAKMMRILIDLLKDSGLELPKPLSKPKKRA